MLCVRFCYTCIRLLFAVCRLTVSRSMCSSYNVTYKLKFKWWNWSDDHSKQYMSTNIGRLNYSTFVFLFCFHILREYSWSRCFLLLLLKKSCWRIDVRRAHNGRYIINLLWWLWMCLMQHIYVRCPGSGTTKYLQMTYERMKIHCSENLTMT